MSPLSLYRRIRRSIGPGVITGIADDDPSGIATYAQTGALFGLQQLWLALYTVPFMIAVQEMCGRIGLVSGRGLAFLMRSHYSRWVLITSVILLTLANTVNIGADLGAMAEATTLILPLSFKVSLIVLTVFTAFAAVFIPYKKYVRILKYFALAVLAYVVTAFTIQHDWSIIWKHLLIPEFSLNSAFILNITAMIGTTISPYLFFWQTSEEVEESVVHHKQKDIDSGTPTLHRRDIIRMRDDTVLGMIASNLITFFIIITSSATLSGNGTLIASAVDMAESLRPLAGDYAVYLFAFGILGTGLLAVPVLAGSIAYAVGESLHIRVGLGTTWKQSPGFYAALVIGLIIGALLNMLHINPMTMLYYAAVFNGMLAGPLLVIILLIANNRKIMGQHTNGILSNLLSVTITLIMLSCTLFTLWQIV